jgi:hypothetical protein
MNAKLDVAVIGATRPAVAPGSWVIAPSGAWTAGSTQA